MTRRLEDEHTGSILVYIDLGVQEELAKQSS